MNGDYLEELIDRYMQPHDRYFAEREAALAKIEAEAEALRQEFRSLASKEDRRFWLEYQFELLKLKARKMAKAADVPPPCTFIRYRASDEDYERQCATMRDLFPLYEVNGAGFYLSPRIERWHQMPPKCAAMTLLKNGETYQIDMRCTWRKYGVGCRVFSIFTPPDFPPFAHVLIDKAGFRLAFLSWLEPQP